LPGKKHNANALADLAPHLVFESLSVLFLSRARPYHTVAKTRGEQGVGRISQYQATQEQQQQQHLWEETKGPEMQMPVFELMNCDLILTTPIKHADDGGQQERHQQLVHLQQEAADIEAAAAAPAAAGYALDGPSDNMNMNNSAVQGQVQVEAPKKPRSKSNAKVIIMPTPCLCSSTLSEPGGLSAPAPSLPDKTSASADPSSHAQTCLNQQAIHFYPSRPTICPHNMSAQHIHLYPHHPICPNQQIHCYPRPLIRHHRKRKQFEDVVMVMWTPTKE
jgi:hypothetical protein